LNLLEPDTIWLFLSGSDEERFLDDVSFGVECLVHRGVLASNVLLFVDQPTPLSIISSHQYLGGMEVFRTSEIVGKISQKSPAKLVVIVTGHGSEVGIDALPPISPFSLIECLKNIKGLTYGLVVLGQCYAGVFNFLEVKKIDPVSRKVVAPEICVVGATDLATSISAFVDVSSNSTLQAFRCAHQWSANLFLLYFMWCVAEPFDIDGDSRNTIIDAYKLAGIRTNGELLGHKKEAFLAFSDAIATSTVSKLTQDPSTISLLVSKAKQDLAMACETILVNQNPWVLNANLARDLEI
jgi:hypothetical protein